MTMITIHELAIASSKARMIRDLERERDGHTRPISVSGSYREDETMQSAIDAAFKAELQRRIDALRSELAELGVDVGPR